VGLYAPGLLAVRKKSSARGMRGVGVEGGVGWRATGKAMWLLGGNAQVRGWDRRLYLRDIASAEFDCICRRVSKKRCEFGKEWPE